MGSMTTAQSWFSGYLDLVALIGYGHTEDREQALEAGFDESSHRGARLIDSTGQ
jgi:hypothetical protein